MKKRFFINAFLYIFYLISCIQHGFSQNFKIDKYGYVNNPKFHQLIKERTYQLVSAFDTITIGSTPKILATVVRNNQIYNLDLSGNETAYYDENAHNIKAREEKLYKAETDAKTKYYQFIYQFNTRYELIKADGKYGLRNKMTGVVILKPLYQSVWSYKGNIISIEDNGKSGIADTSGKIIINPVYDRIDLCMIDTGEVKYFIGYKKDLATLIDRKGKQLFEPKYDIISPYTANQVLYSSFKNNGEAIHGLISKEGRILLEPKYSSFYSIPNSNLFRTDMNVSRKYGLVNKNGKIIYEPSLEFVDIGGDDKLICIYENEKVGFVDKEGNVVIKPIYNRASCYDDDQLILVGNEFKKNAIISSYKYGLIDFYNKLIIPVEYDELVKTNDWFLGKKDGKYYRINKDGRVTSNFAYKEMKYVNNGLFIALNTAGLYGVVDKQQRTVIPFAYSQIEKVGKFYFSTPKGVIDSENNLVLPKRWLTVTYTNALPLRESGIFVMEALNRKVICKDRYNNEYDPNDLMVK